MTPEAVDCVLVAEGGGRDVWWAALTGALWVIAAVLVVVALQMAF